MKTLKSQIKDDAWRHGFTKEIHLFEFELGNGLFYVLKSPIAYQIDNLVEKMIEWEIDIICD